MNAGGVESIEGVPHRPPVLLIDRLLDASSASATAEGTLREGPWTEGDEVWELALVEGLAQTAAALVSAERRRRGRSAPASGMLVGVKRFEWARRARAGSTREARRAGSHAAAVLTAARTTGTARKVMGSVAVTSKRSASSRRLRAKAPTRPRKTPVAVTPMP